MITSVLFYVVAFYFYTYGTLRASRVIHNDLISSILATTLRSAHGSFIILRCSPCFQMA